MDAARLKTEGEGRCGKWRASVNSESLSPPGFPIAKVGFNLCESPSGRRPCGTGRHFRQPLRRSRALHYSWVAPPNTRKAIRSLCEAHGFRFAPRISGGSSRVGRSGRGHSFEPHHSRRITGRVPGLLRLCSPRRERVDARGAAARSEARLSEAQTSPLGSQHSAKQSRFPPAGAELRV